MIANLLHTAEWIGLTGLVAVLLGATAALVTWFCARYLSRVLDQPPSNIVNLAEVRGRRNKKAATTSAA